MFKRGPVLMLVRREVIIRMTSSRELSIWCEISVGAAVSIPSWTGKNLSLYYFVYKAWGWKSVESCCIVQYFYWIIRSLNQEYIFFALADDIITGSVSSTSGASQTNCVTVQVSSFLNVRSGPSTSNAIVGQVSPWRHQQQQYLQQVFVCCLLGIK